MDRKLSSLRLHSISKPTGIDILGDVTTLPVALAAFQGLKELELSSNLRVGNEGRCHSALDLAPPCMKFTLLANLRVQLLDGSAVDLRWKEVNCL